MSRVAVLAILLLVPSDDFLGRWDLTIVGPEGQTYPSWLEVTREAGTLKARMVGRGGSVFPVPDVAIENGGLKFQYSRGQSGAATVYEAQMKGGRLEGTMVTGTGPTSTWTGVRAPKWPEAKKLGTPQLLFNGKDLSGWLPQNPSRPLGWTVKDGALANEGKANNIYSEKMFFDFKLEVEFNVAAKSNSGVYLRGRYEIQVMDDFGSGVLVCCWLQKLNIVEEPSP